MSTGVNFVYGKARASFGQAGINLLTADIRAMLVSAAYSPAPNTDQYVSSIPSGAVIIRDVALTGKSFSISGGFVGTIPTFDALIAAQPCVAVILYAYTGTDSTSKLLYYSSDGPGFPFLPTGFDYTVGYDQSSGGWFQA